MKKLLFIPLMVIPILNYGQKLDSMKYVRTISYTNRTENIFDKQEKLRQNILGDIPKLSKQEIRFSLDRYKGNPSLLHPDVQRQQYILNPTNSRTPGQALLGGLLGWRNY